MLSISGYWQSESERASLNSVNFAATTTATDERLVHSLRWTALPSSKFQEHNATGQLPRPIQGQFRADIQHAVRIGSSVPDDLLLRGHGLWYNPRGKRLLDEANLRFPPIKIGLQAERSKNFLWGSCRSSNRSLRRLARKIPVQQAPSPKKIARGVWNSIFRSSHSERAIA